MAAIGPTPNENLLEVLEAAYNAKPEERKEKMSRVFALLDSGKIAGNKITLDDLLAARRTAPEAFYKLIMLPGVQVDYYLDNNSVRSYQPLIVHIVKNDTDKDTIKIVKRLLAKKDGKAEFPEQTIEAVMAPAAGNGLLDVIDYCLKVAKSDKLTLSQTIIFNTVCEAAQHGKFDIVLRFLVKEKGRYQFPITKLIADKNYAVLLYAAKHKRFDVVNLLFEFPTVVRRIASDLSNFFKKAENYGIFQFFAIRLFVLKPNSEPAFPQILAEFSILDLDWQYKIAQANLEVETTTAALQSVLLSELALLVRDYFGMDILRDIAKSVFLKQKSIQEFLRRFPSEPKKALEEKKKDQPLNASNGVRFSSPSSASFPPSPSQTSGATSDVDHGEEEEDEEEDEEEEEEEREELGRRCSRFKIS